MSAAFLLPAGFSADVASGRAAAIEVVGDVNAQLGTEAARSVAGSFTELAFAFVAGGAGMVLGPVFRTEQQVGGAALLLGIGFAALGGPRCRWSCSATPCGPSPS